MYGMKGREQYTDDAVMALFEGIRTLFKDISSLTELALYNCYDGFEEIGEAIVEEKRGGKAFDLRKLWESITPNRDYGTGSGHPFPHPIHTNKNASLSNLPRLSLF